MTMNGTAGAALYTTAIAICRRLAWFPFETSSEATSAVQPIVMTKIRARHQGSHFRATLRGDSLLSPSFGGDGATATSAAKPLAL